MIYRQSNYMSDDLDARARLFELASEGITVRSAAAEKRAAAETRAEQAKAKQALRWERRQERCRMRAANLQRMIATSRLRGLLTWEWSLYVFGALVILILSLMPVWILAARMGPLGFAILATLAVLPLAVTFSMRLIAGQCVREERHWLDSRGLVLEGHWKALGERTT